MLVGAGAGGVREGDDDDSGARDAVLGAGDVVLGGDDGAERPVAAGAAGSSGLADAVVLRA